MNNLSQKGQRAPLPKALDRPHPGRVLAFVPHADDDVLGLGGTLCLHAEGGDPVKVVVLFDGVLGDPDGRYTPDELRGLRRVEARAGGAHLGLADYEFWDYPEGHIPLPEEFEAAADRVAALIQSFAPDLIYAPHVGEYHLDHHIASRVVRAAIKRSAFPGRAFGFEVWTPLVAEEIVDVSSVEQRKLAALREHKTQLEYNDFIHKVIGLGAQRSLYLSPKARYGEAFRRLVDE